MWENIKISLKDKNFRLKAIAILVVAFVIISFVLWFSFSVDAASLVSTTYKMRVQNGYGGIYYPLNASDGFSLSTGVFYNFPSSNLNLFDSNGDPVTKSSPYLTFSFDFSGLNPSYDYSLEIFGLSGGSVSFDGFLTTYHTFSSNSDQSVTASFTRYTSSFYPDRVVVNQSSSVDRLVYYFEYPLSSLNDLTVSLSGTYFFSFAVVLSGSDFQQLLYNSGTIQDYDDYIQLIDDTRDALASGDISSDQAGIILDNATNAQSQLEVTHIVEAQTALNNIVQQFINSSSSLSGSDLASSFENYSDRLYTIVQSYMGVISSPEEGIALSDVYQIVVRQLEQAYESLLTASYYNSLGFVNQSFDSYKQNESFLIDNVKSINLSNVIQITSWVDTLDELEIFTFKTLLDSFVSNFSWSIFVQVPLYFTVIIALLGTSRSKEE